MIYGAGTIGGPAGWRLLQRTAAAQTALLAKEPGIVREQAALSARMAANPQAEDLVADYQGLKVALTAFGLEGDLPNKAFIRKVLTSDLADPKSLVNRLSDKRYRKLAEAFSFTATQPPKGDAIAARVNSLYLDREFERRVGETDPNMRLAMNAKRELNLIANRKSTENTKWFEILANSPLSQVVRQGLGMPDTIARAPLDRQVDALSEAASRQLGIDGPGGLADPAKLGKLIDAFLVRASSTGQTMTPYATALAILGRG